MIIINDLTLPADNIVSRDDYFIGVVGDNEYETKLFRLPKIYRKVDISADYVFTLEVENEQGKYIDVLSKTVDDDYIYLTWIIKRHDCIKGSIKVLIKAQSTLNDIVKQSFPMHFECVEGVNATDDAVDIPPSILEQAILEATAQADRAKAEADRVASMLSQFASIKTYVGSTHLPIIMEYLTGGSLVSLAGYVKGTSTSAHMIYLTHTPPQPSNIYNITRLDDYVVATCMVGNVMYSYTFDLVYDHEPVIEIKNILED